MPRRLPVTPLLALLLAAPLAAQPPGAAPPRPTSDSVPRELVQALLPDSDGLRVGEPAGDLPRELLPPNGIVLGSAEFGSYSTTVAVVMQPEHEAIEAHEARARAAGWTPPSAAVSMSFDGGSTRGFIPSGSALGGAMMVGSAMGAGRGTTRSTASAPLCRGNAMLVATSSPWSGGRTLLRLQSMNAAQFSPCRPRRPEIDGQLVRTVTVYDSIIPALRPPATAQVRPAGWSGGGMNEWETRATIESSLSAGDLLAHYAAEMAREEWAPIGDAAATPAAAVRLWKKTAADGRTWHATITLASRPEPRQYRAVLRLEREGER